MDRELLVAHSGIWKEIIARTCSLGNEGTPPDLERFFLSEIPYLRLQSHSELWSRSWHGWFLEQSVLVWNLFYNQIFLDVLFKRLDGEKRLSRCLLNTSTFVPNDRSQCLYCVLPIMRCAFGAHLDVGLAERRTPCRFVGNLTFFLGEDGRIW